MTARKKAKGERANKPRYIKVKDLPIHWNELRETRPEQDAAFQTAMQAAGYEQHTSSDCGTNIPKNYNTYSDGSTSSPQGWDA